MLSGAHPDGLPRGLCDQLGDIRAQTVTRLEARLRQAREAGEIGSDADPAAIAAFYATVHQGMSFRARDGATPEELRGTARAAMLAWDGLAAADAAAR